MNLLPQQEINGHPLKLRSDNVFRTGKLTVVESSNFYYGTESIYLVQTEIKSKSQRIGPLVMAQ